MRLSRHTGSFILIDPVSHATVAAGMVREILSGRRHRDPVAAIAIRNPELLRLLETAIDRSGRGSGAHPDSQSDLCCSGCYR